MHNLMDESCQKVDDFDSLSSFKVFPNVIDSLWHDLYHLNHLDM